MLHGYDDANSRSGREFVRLRAIHAAHRLWWHNSGHRLSKFRAAEIRWGVTDLGLAGDRQVVSRV